MTMPDAYYWSAILPSPMISAVTAPTVSNYSYNNDGQLTTIKTNGQTSKFEYNTIGKISKVTCPDEVAG